MHNRITKNLIKSRSLLHIMKVGPTTIPYNDKLKIENWKLKYTQLLFRTENQNRNHKRPRSRNNHGWVLSIMIQESWIQVDVKSCEKNIYIVIEWNWRSENSYSRGVLKWLLLGLSGFVGPAKWEFLSNKTECSLRFVPLLSFIFHIPILPSAWFSLHADGPSMETHRLMPNGPLDNMGLIK